MSDTEWQLARKAGRWRSTRLHLAWHVLRGRPLVYRVHFEMLHVRPTDKHIKIVDCWAGPATGNTGSGATIYSESLRDKTAGELGLCDD